MALIKTKPTSPGTRFVVKVDRSHLHKGEPVRAADVERRSATGARNNSAASPRATRAAVTSSRYRIVDFLRDKDGVAGQGRARSSTIRTAPRTSRSCCTRTASVATSSRRRASRPATTIRSGAEAPIKAGNAHAAAQHPDRHARCTTSS